MKRFDRIKTIQLVILLAITVAVLVLVFRDRQLYQLIAADGHIRVFAILLWAVLAASFVFLFYDFHSFAELRRENLELDHAIYADALTGIANRYSVDVYIGQFLNKHLPEDMGCITIELTSLGMINEKHGHEGGDRAIQDFSEILSGAASGVCFIGRNGGNKFVAIFRECSVNRLERFQNTVREQLEKYNAHHSDAVIEASFGVAFEEGERVHTLTELVALSDRRAYKKAKLEK